MNVCAHEEEFSDGVSMYCSDCGLQTAWWCEPPGEWLSELPEGFKWTDEGWMSA